MTLPESPVALIIVFTLVVCVTLLLVSGTFQLWLTARLAKAPVSVSRIISMKMRFTAKNVVYAYITAQKAGVPIELDELEALYLSAPKRFEHQVVALIQEKTK